MVASFLAAALGLVVLRILIPGFVSLLKRVRAYGPVSFTTPGAGGGGLGWLLALFWGVGEKRREEGYGYMRNPAPASPAEDEAPSPDEWRPQAARGELNGHPVLPDEPREFQPLTPDGRWWWNGKRWAESRRFVPPAAVRSEDGEHWWDGQMWQRLPNPGLARGEWRPRPVPLKNKRRNSATKRRP